MSRLKSNELTLKRIRAAGVRETCPRGCAPDIEREPASIALFCVPCGWRYDLTPEQNKRARQILGIKGLQGARLSNDLVAERDKRIARMYRLGVNVAAIAGTEDVTTQAVYESLKRSGVPRNHRQTKSLFKYQRDKVST